VVASGFEAMQLAIGNNFTGIVQTRLAHRGA